MTHQTWRDKPPESKQQVRKMKKEEEEEVEEKNNNNESKMEKNESSRCYAQNSVRLFGKYCNAVMFNMS